jgi:hypothetical protein
MRAIHVLFDEDLLAALDETTDVRERGGRRCCGS